MSKFLIVFSLIFSSIIFAADNSDKPVTKDEVKAKAPTEQKEKAKAPKEEKEKELPEEDIL